VSNAILPRATDANEPRSDAVADWSRDAPAGLPPAGEIWLWRAELHQDERAETECRGWLSADELRRAAAARLPDVARRFVLARGLLRGVLASCLGTEPGRVAFRYGPHGKPALDAESPLRFNLSHSGDIAVLAVALDNDLGVDVERVRPGVNVTQIANRYLSRSDAARILALPEDERTREFFRCWTKREAYLKALGTGLAGSEAAMREPTWDEGMANAIQEFASSDGYLGALASLGSCRIARKLQWSPPSRIL
jgi:4'-phosphopantetheinyl transferase